MNDYKKKLSQKRATFNDTLHYQENLRNELDRLEQENDIVQDEGKFFELLGRALLGLDAEADTIIRTPEGIDITIINVGKFIRKLTYYDKNIITQDFLKEYTSFEIKPFPISKLWREIKHSIFGVYPEALKMSIKMSKEQTHYGPSDAAKV